MLIPATALLAGAAAIGLLLAAWHARSRPPLVLGGLHALLGLCGLALLVFALRAGPPRGVAMGAGAFGTVAAVLLAAALLVGGLLLTARLRRKPLPGLTLAIGLHATLAIAGVVLLAAYVSMPS